MNDRYNRNTPPSSRTGRPSAYRSTPAGSRNPGYHGDARTARPSPYASRPQSRPAQRPQNARSAQQRPAGRAAAPAHTRRKNGKILLKILKGILLVFAALSLAIGKVFSGLNRKLDVFRRSEASSVIVNCIVGGVLVSILLIVFLLCKPGIDASRVRSLAADGNSAAAMKLADQLADKGYPSEKLQSIQLEMANSFLKNADFDAADALIADMPAGSEKQNLADRSSYGRADALYASGDYAAAAQLFYQMNNYQDSADRYADCRCALAIEAWQQGDENSARSLLLDVPDVALRVQAAARKVAGSDTGAQAILSAELFHADNLNRMEQTMQHLNAARSDMPKGRIAAGRWHTIGLKSDGTLLAAGDNSMGQLDVGSWTSITQVAAGAFHTVALRTDGTVLATGNNSQGQCDVSGWTDIIAIAASACDTIGLKRDGTVVACGMNSSKVSGWHGVSFVTGGSYSLACLYDKGAMLSSHPGAQMPMGVSLYNLSVCGPVSAGILYDGSMISTFDGAPAWTDMVSVTVCETGILGISVDGQVKSHFYRSSDAVDFNISGSALEIESSGTHHVVLTSDGKVHAFGNNDYGQCGVSGWQL